MVMQRTRSNKNKGFRAVSTPVLKRSFTRRPSGSSTSARSKPSVRAPYAPPPEPTPGLLWSGVGVFLSGPLQLASCPAGTLDDDFTLLAHDYVLCTEQLAPLAFVGVT